MSNRTENEGGFGPFLAGFIIGGLVGAAVALVLAPQSGEETRSQLTNRSTEWRDLVNENRQTWTESMSQMGQSASSALGGIDLNSLTGKKPSQDTQIEDDEQSA